MDRPNLKLEMLNVYGPSVFTVGLQDWPRHRKAVAAPFNQSIMKFVWDTTLGQTQYVFPSCIVIHYPNTVHAALTRAVEEQ